MGAPGMLAHGGSAGAVFEVGFILVPIAVFAILSRVSKRRRDQADTPPEGEAG